MSWLSKRLGRGIGVLAVLGLLAFLALPAMADGPPVGFSWHIQKEIELYGNLQQQHVPGIGACACGPTAAVNSFVYLENKYPNVYDNLLVPAGSAQGINYDPENGPVVDAYDDMAAVAAIVGGPNYMDCVCPGGTYDDMFIFGKQKYLEQVAPGKTIYAAQLKATWNWPGRPAERMTPGDEKPDWVADNTIPTWWFLYDNLVACEDVEILIVDGDWGHYLTLTSFDWEDANQNFVIDQGEAEIDYIDPCTGAWAASPIWQSGINTQLYVPYGYYTAAQLVMAVKESPVPEPATALLILVGAACLLGRRRR